MRKYGVECIQWLLASYPNLTTSEIAKALGIHRQNVERKIARLLQKDVVTRVLLHVPFENQHGIYYRPSWCYSLSRAPMRLDTSGRVQYDPDELNILDFLYRCPDASFAELRHGIQPDDWRKMQKRLIRLQRKGMVKSEDDLRANSPGGKLKTVRTYHLA
jgi:DNA-binding CsgD family transcriptional regulator